MRRLFPVITGSSTLSAAAGGVKPEGVKPKLFHFFGSPGLRQHENSEKV
jgi:hypothetical protein